MQVFQRTEVTTLLVILINKEIAFLSIIKQSLIKHLHKLMDLFRNKVLEFFIGQQLSPQLSSFLVLGFHQEQILMDLIHSVKAAGMVVVLDSDGIQILECKTDESS